MKQYITVEQLKELTEEQKQKLRDWWLPKAGDIAVIRYGYLSCGNTCIIDTYNREYNYCSFIIPENGYGSRSKEAFDVFLSIGRMIELLHKKDAVNHHFIQAYHNMWRVNARENIELCDALWEAVKALL